MDARETLLYPYIVTLLITFVLAQVCTLLILKHEKVPFKWSLLTSLTARPDALTAIASSLLVAHLIVENTTSYGFAVLLILLWIVVESRVRSGYFVLTKKSVLQVLVPTIGLGVVGGLIGTFAYWVDSLRSITDVASDTQQTVMLGWYVLLLIVSEVTIITIRRSSLRMLPTSRRLIRAFRLSYSVVGFLGIGLISAQKSFDSTLLDSKIWYFATIVWVLLASALSYRNVYKKAKSHLKQEYEHFKKQKKVARKQSKKKQKRKK